MVFDLEKHAIKAAPNHLIVNLKIDEYLDDTRLADPDVLFKYVESGGSAIIYTAEVLDVGKNVKEINKGDFVMFNAFAGIHLPVKDNLIKVIEASAPLTKLKEYKYMDKITIEDLQPLGDRVLMEVLTTTDFEEDENAMLVDNKEYDKRIENLTIGRILKVGPEATGIVKVGDIVAIEHFVGEIVRPELPDKREIRAMSELYITAIISQKDGSSIPTKDVADTELIS